jgi:hypothetical protein
MATPEKQKVSQKENAAPDSKGHEGEIWHKPFEYKTKAGKLVKVAGHWERKPGSGPKPEAAQPAKAKARRVKGKKQGRSVEAKKATEATGDAAACNTSEAEADA